MQKEWVNSYQPSLKFSGKERESKSELDYFGARYYDHLKYRFISVDPVINKEEALGNPQLWNLYAYCGNNPITNIDPDGRKFDYTWCSTSFIVALDQIKSYLSQNPIANAILQQAENMTETITLIESPLSSIHKNGTIWFDPYAGNQIDNGGIQSPALGFLHEVAHAIRRFRDPVGLKNDRIAVDNDYDNKEEKRVITGIETKVAKPLGEPVRQNHNGSLVKVDSPTYHKDR
jgi:RHS repeat-associated protein